MRRALLVAVSATALTAAGAFAFAPGRAPRRRSAEAQGSYCPVRPAASGPVALLSVDSGAHMTTVPSVHTSIDSRAIAAESLLAPVPTICRSAPETAAKRGTAPQIATQSASSLRRGAPVIRARAVESPTNQQLTLA